MCRILHERLTIQQVIGAADILASVYIASISGVKEKGTV